jgi:hypothetical protein
MVNHIYTWSDFRKANPEFGDDLDGHVTALRLLRTTYENKDDSNNWDLSDFARCGCAR